MKFTGLTKMQIYHLIKNDPAALKDARWRVAPSAWTDTVLNHTILAALTLYREINNTHSDDFVRREYKNMELEELTNLVITDKKVRYTLMSMVSRNNRTELKIDIQEKYIKALEAWRTVRAAEKLQRLKK